MEALRECAVVLAPNNDQVEAAEAKGREFMLADRLFRSHRTGEIVNPRFLRLSFPPHWHHDVLRSLDYFHAARALDDARLQDAIDVVEKKRDEDGRWPLQQRWPGESWFEMETVGEPSRWNTLRAMRVLEVWRGCSTRLDIGSPDMHRLVASFFGSGLLLRRIRGSDAGSGTVGGLFALPISLWLGSRFGWQAQLGGAAILFLASLWSARPLAAEVGDAGWIVIDEAAGVFVATIGLLGWPAIIAFVVFRIADITKRLFPGVHQADALPGALGITVDDTVAGMYGLAIGHLLNATVF